MFFCDERRKDAKKICIISSPKDAFALDQTGEYLGLYHVLPALLSPLDGISPEDLQLETVLDRIHQESIEEVIIALDSTLEGDATSLFIKETLASLPVKMTRLAFGLPMGSSLDYIDGNTLARALLGRT